MCNHVFVYPEDSPDNYDEKGMKLMGACKFCGMRQLSYGRRWAIRIEESFKGDVPFGSIDYNLDEYITSVVK